MRALMLSRIVGFRILLGHKLVKAHVPRERIRHLQPLSIHTTRQARSPEVVMHITALHPIGSGKKGISHVSHSSL